MDIRNTRDKYVPGDTHVPLWRVKPTMGMGTGKMPDNHGFTRAIC